MTFLCCSAYCESLHSAKCFILFDNISMTFVQSPLRICMKNTDHKFYEGIKRYWCVTYSILWLYQLLLSLQIFLRVNSSCVYKLPFKDTSYAFHCCWNITGWVFCHPKKHSYKIFSRVRKFTVKDWPVQQPGPPVTGDSHAHTIKSVAHPHMTLVFPLLTLLCCSAHRSAVNLYCVYELSGRQLN